MATRVLVEHRLPSRNGAIRRPAVTVEAFGQFARPSCLALAGRASIGRSTYGARAQTELAHFLLDKSGSQD